MFKELYGTSGWNPGFYPEQLLTAIDTHILDFAHNFPAGEPHTSEVQKDCFINFFTKILDRCVLKQMAFETDFTTRYAPSPIRFAGNFLKVVPKSPTSSDQEIILNNMPPLAVWPYRILDSQTMSAEVKENPIFGKDRDPELFDRLANPEYDGFWLGMNFCPPITPELTDSSPKAYAYFPGVRLYWCDEIAN
jgi:hypothetical protein